jgi:hypothetical protein
VVEAVGTTGKLAAATVVVAGKTATAAVKTTGRIATSVIGGSGSLTAGGIEALAKLARAGMVTFVDAATGVVVRVPWQKGMTLYAGGALAEVRVAERGIDLVRRGRLIFTAAKRVRANPRLEAGDVVRLAGRGGAR